MAKAGAHWCEECSLLPIMTDRLSLACRLAIAADPARQARIALYAERAERREPIFAEIADHAH